MSASTKIPVDRSVAEFLGWGPTNMLASAGALVLFASFAVFLVNVLRSLKHGEAAGANPWNAPTLEWATSSPPPPHNFDRIPVVTHREPLWAEPGALPVATGLRVDLREVVTTSLVEAEPETRESSPQPSIWPLLSAIAVAATFIGSIFTPWAVVYGTAPVAIALIVWFWPKGSKEDEEGRRRVPPSTSRACPASASARRARCGGARWASSRSRRRDSRWPAAPSSTSPG